MKDRIEASIKYLNSKITKDSCKPHEAQQLAQAILNLANALSVIDNKE